MSRPAGWVILLLGAAVACIGYLGSARYPASLSAIPYLEELLPFLAEGWREQRDLYASIFESKVGVFVRGHPMEMMGGYGLTGLFLLLSRGYRDAGWEHCLLVLWYGLFIPILFFLGLVVAQWGFDIFHFFSRESMTSKVARMHTDPTGWLLDLVGGFVIGIPAILIGLVVALVEDDLRNIGKILNTDREERDARDFEARSRRVNAERAYQERFQDNTISQKRKDHEVKRLDIEEERIESERLEAQIRRLESEKRLEELRKPPPEPAKKTTSRARSEKQTLRARAYTRRDKEIEKIEAMKEASPKTKADLKKAAENELEEALERIEKMP